MVSSPGVRDPDVTADLRDAQASHGGKAFGLARLIAAGLPVPPGFVISTAAFERFAAGVTIAPEELELATWLRELGPLVAVRSSAAIEDGSAGSGAGIFVSRVAVPASVEAVWDAIRAVWSSALTPQAVEYAHRRTHEVALGVIVQRYIEGERVVVYTQAPGLPDELVIQRGAHLCRAPRAALPTPLADHQAAVQALRAERALAAPADVELIQVAPRPGVIETWVVQARPIVQRVPAVFVAPPPIVLAPLQDGRVWTWDVTHNPDPLSPAQASLCERVAKTSTYELRVCAGYLYSSPRAAQPDFTSELTAALVSQCRLLVEDLRRGPLGSPSTAPREPVPTAPPPTRAIEQYVEFHVAWSTELSPRIAELRRRAGRVLAHRPSSIEATLSAAARGSIDLREVVHRIGAVAPTWDVATPTFGEQPELLERAIALAKTDAPVITAAMGSERDELASIAADLAEQDDLLFARAQWRVRQALLDLADDLGIARDDIFWIAFSDLAQPLDAEAARRKASGARNAAARASRWQMPLVVGGDPIAPRQPLRGVGHGPRITGRVVRFASLAAATLASPGDVIVVRAVTPALAVFVGRCAALVSETGGLLDHGAALARELGITCVVGCHDAWTSLTEGQVVEVDGAAGTVTPQ
ncbi:hypothetical protein BH11MYX1_BH11MYX1_17920 [soil metagenome]